MHQGAIPVPQSQSFQPQHPKHEVPPIQQQQINGAPPAAPPNAASLEDLISGAAPPNAASIEDLISGASKKADGATVSPVPDVSPTNGDTAESVAVPTRDKATDDKKEAKEKDKAKATRLVYSDNNVSPEEKMATLARYAFTPQQRTAMA